MHSIPGTNHLSMAANSNSMLSQLLNQLEKKNINRIKRVLMHKLIRKEEEAITVLSRRSVLPLTYLTCAFFNKLILAVSKMPVIERNNIQTPNFEGDNDRVSNIKLINPKKVIENRCRKV
jgi:hypothetical protein